LEGGQGQLFLGRGRGVTSPPKGYLAKLEFKEKTSKRGECDGSLERRSEEGVGKSNPKAQWNRLALIKKMTGNEGQYGGLEGESKRRGTLLVVAESAPRRGDVNV